MIISASRRTDIPRFFSPWFFHRLQEGFVLVRNPMNPRRISRVSLDPAVVDGLVLWTKDPTPMLGGLAALDPYAYYFQFTLTAYGPDVEPRLHPKAEGVIPAFRRLADRIGPDRVIWRYDPIFLSARYSADFHRRSFESLARQLAPHTRQCIISFLDEYRNTRRNMAGLSLQPFGPEQQRALAADLAAIARGFGLAVNTCAEALDLSDCGIGRAHCIDGALLSRLAGCPLDLRRDPGQRPACGCVQSIDIGAYDTCPGGCLYCYANHSPRLLQTRLARHDPAGALLTGTVGPEDRVTERRMTSCRQTQLSFL